MFFSEVDEITSEVVLSFSEVVLFCSEGVSFFSEIVSPLPSSRAYTLHNTHVFCLHCLHHPQKNTSQRPNSPLRPCFSTLPFTISLHLCLHLCLHPYSPDFQALSPIGEGVKAICTHYIVYTRVRAREAKGKNREEAGAGKKGTAPHFAFLFLGFGSGSARQVARTSAAR